jgi:16S rRNA (cytosine967-C5)-methyltransferase
MYPGRIKHLLELWREYWFEVPYDRFDLWLARAFQKRRFMGKKDRLWYSDALYNAFRFGLCALEEAKVAELSQSRESLAQYFAHHCEESFFEKVEARAQLELEAPPVFASVAEACRFHGWHPAWGPYLAGSVVRDLLAEFNKRAPLWIRVRSNEDAGPVESELVQHDFEVEKWGLSWKLKGRRSLYDFETFARGAFEVQDWASQEIGKTLPLANAKRLWDACAGGGGKTLQLAVSAPPTCELFASDIREHKLRELEMRAERAGLLSRLEVFPWDARSDAAGAALRLKEGLLDGALIDAPCSSSGTIRRSPELKMQDPALLLQPVLEVQRILLEKVSACVRPGGELVYATCSFLPQENEDAVKLFLREHADWSLIEERNLGLSQGVDSDAMYCARLQRV